MANRLADATSPYLLQHAGNPVDWWQWSDAAFDEASRRDVPVLLSVGYAACHWCHVMAHESFEDDATARLMNDLFVNVKVDREERPDVDAVYMEATQAMTGQGGWPMTVFCTPDGQPFYCGTYFPSGPRHGMPAFTQVLQAVSAAWHDRRDEAVNAGAEVARALGGRRLPDGGELPGPEHLDAAVQVLAEQHDARNGGFGGAPKFPPSMSLEHLLRHHARTGSSDALAVADHTCEAMARGGMYDQLGGGFARYSVDAQWVVPHFEKMLYDNALLLRVYAHLWRVTGSSLARRVALDTAGWVLRDLRTPEGAFASALDADSEGVEGRYYVWTPSQLAEVLGPEDGRWAAATTSVTEQGTFEHGSSVLQMPADPDDAERWDAVRARLLTAREERVPPARDDKVVAAWNGLAVAALAETGALLERPDLVDAAVGAAEVLARVHLADGRLRRTSRGGVAGDNAGVLEDYGDVAEGLLALYGVTGDTRWLVRAGELLDTVLAHFVDEDGFHDTADDTTDSRLGGIRRPHDPTDNATPSGQSAAAGALLSYAALTGSSRHREAAERALTLVPSVGAAHPRALGWGLAVAEALVTGPLEVAVVGPSGDPATTALHATALRGTSPGSVVALGEPGAGGVPLLEGRGLVGGRPAAYVCRGFTCDMPVTTAEELARLVNVHAGG